MMFSPESLKRYESRRQEILPVQSTPQTGKKKSGKKKDRKPAFQREDAGIRATLRSTLYSNLKSRSQIQATERMEDVRDSTQPDRVSFDVIENSQNCISAISSPQPEAPATSTMRTRSQKRNCSGRIPGFYSHL